MNARDVAIKRLAESMRMTTEEVLRPTGLMVPALGRAFDTVAWDELARIAMDDAALVAVDPAMGGRLRVEHAACAGRVAYESDEGDMSTSYGGACADLADSILEQLEPPR